MEQRWRNARSIVVLFFFWLLVASNDASLGERLTRLVPLRGGARQNATQTSEGKVISSQLMNYTKFKSLELRAGDSEEIGDEKSSDSAESVCVNNLEAGSTLEGKRLQFFDRGFQLRN